MWIQSTMITINFAMVCMELPWLPQYIYIKYCIALGYHGATKIPNDSGLSGDGLFLDRNSNIHYKPQFNLTATTLIYTNGIWLLWLLALNLHGISYPNICINLSNLDSSTLDSSIQHQIHLNFQIYRCWYEVQKILYIWISNLYTTLSKMMPLDLKNFTNFPSHRDVMSWQYEVHKNLIP